jgi:translation initiation factor IF-3
MRRRFQTPDRAPRVRVNERIRIPEVRVVGDDGEQIGVMPTRQALEYARERGLDLVEVSPSARPPVCRVMDYGKFKYEQAKKTRAAKKKAHAAQVKEVKFRPKIDDHDYDFKVANARKFLEQHHKVKLTIMFRGREMARRERGYQLLERVVEDLKDIAQLEHPPKQEGRNLSTMVSPRSSKGRAKTRGEGGDEAADGSAPQSAGGGGAPAARPTAAPAERSGAAPAGRQDAQPSGAPGSGQGTGGD